jgi:hypothetical protein
MRRLILVLLAWAMGGMAPAHAQEEASGTVAPVGPPPQAIVRVDAGGACIIDLVQAYETGGTLVGKLEIDYRIFVDGACGSPPGTFYEEWIAFGTFTGTAAGHAASASLWYRADVTAGGVVEGSISFAGDVVGEVAVSGRFSDGRLSYHGLLEP